MVHYAGINFVDTYQRAGRYPVPLHLVLGLEGSGVAENLDNVQGSDLAVGDRVAWTRITSSYADHISTPPGNLIKLPAEISLELGAAAFLQGLTSLSLATLSLPFPYPFPTPSLPFPYPFPCHPGL